MDAEEVAASDWLLGLALGAVLILHAPDDKADPPPAGGIWKARSLEHELDGCSLGLDGIGSVEAHDAALDQELQDAVLGADGVVGVEVLGVELAVAEAPPLVPVAVVGRVGVRLDAGTEVVESKIASTRGR